MVTRSAIRAVIMIGCCAGAQVLTPRTVWGQPASLPAVPSYVAKALRDSLDVVRNGLEGRLQAYSSRKSAYDAKCSVIRADDVGTIQVCKADYAAVIPEANALQREMARFASYISGLDSLNVAAPALVNVKPVALAESAAPMVAEESQLRSNPTEWYDQQALRVRHAVYLNAKWFGEVLKAVTGSTQLPSSSALTKLSALSAGDVLLISPVAVQHSATEYVKGELISLGDYGIRAITAFANGGLSGAAGVQRSNVSHSLTFIREVNGHKLFLDHDKHGTRVIDETQFLKSYGMREMLVARPMAVVDGRELWDAARNLALTERGYGVTGDRVVCSQMCAIAVARATKTGLTAGNLGPIDVTPGDFYDKTGNVGKHFVVTRLTLAPLKKSQ